MKPRIRVKAPTLMFGRGVPDDARPGDLVVGNRGAAAHVLRSGGALFLHHIGNVQDGRHVQPAPGCKVYDFRW